MKYINKALGENIRRLRISRKMTLDHLASETGVSKSMIGQIERGEANPTIAIIWKIANGLKVSFSMLIASTKEENSVIDKSQVTVLKSEDGLFENIPFFPFNAKRNFEMFEVIIKPGGYLNGDDHPPHTEEFVIVFDGNLVIEYSGTTNIIGENQAFSFCGDVPHNYSNIGSVPTRFALVLFYENIIA